MGSLTWLDGSFTLRLMLTLFHFLWQGMVVASVVALVARGLSRASAQSRYVINTAALAIMATCLPVTFMLLGVPNAEIAVADPQSLGGMQATQVAATPSTSEPLPDEPARNGALLEVKSDSADLRPNATLVSIAGMDVRRLLHSSAPYMTAFYMLGVAAMLLRTMIALRGGHRLRVLATPVDEPSLLAEFRQLIDRVGLKTAPPIAYCGQISVPVVVGILRPMILLPATLASGLSPDQVQALIAHELAHIRRFDQLVNLLQRVIEALLFFHPAVWYVSRRVSLERENATDDLVLAMGWRRVDYADALLRMAELSSAFRKSADAAPLTVLAASGAASTEFKSRILRLLGTDRPRLCLTRGGMLVMALAAAFVLVTPLILQIWTANAKDVIDGQVASPPVSQTGARAVANGEEATEPGTAKPGQASDESTDIDLEEFWRKVFEANSVWLDPRPPRLHYTLTGSVTDPERPTEFTEQVWLDGERWRFEMESKLTVLPDEPARTSEYTAVSNGHEMVYLRAPRESMLGVRKPSQDAHRLRQGLIWWTAMHAAQKHGLPEDCHIARVDASGEMQIVVLEMTFPKVHRMNVGLGLHHIFLGQTQRPIGRVRIHIAMPERRPVLEEHFGEDSDEATVRIEYAPDYLKLGERCAPSMIRMVRGVPIFKAKQWVLEATFQDADGIWLLDKAVNKLDDKINTQIQLTDLSTDSVDPSLFEMQTEAAGTDADTGN